MPYVQESRESSDGYYPTGGSGSGTKSGTWYQLNSASAAQYGWRSKGEQEAASAALETSSKKAKWADTISLVAAYDRFERSMSNPIVRPEGLPVHERTYTETKLHNANPVCRLIDVRTGNTYYTAQPRMGVSFYSVPAMATDTNLRSTGGNMLRESRPTKPYANLGQWFGELKQFGGMFNVPRELPEELVKYKSSSLDELRRFREGGRAVGSGYLASQFGWLPFVGEVINSLDAVANSGKLIDDFVRDSAKLIRRTRRKVTYQDATVYSGTLGGTGLPDVNHVSSTTQLGAQLTQSWQKSIGLANFKARYVSTVTRVDSFRTSAIFEYFAADPEGFLGTSRRLAQEAKYLLGDPLISLSTFWELAPWSWAIDWSYNLGGLLSFQESVATDSLVARRCSTVFEREISVVTRWEPYFSDSGTSVQYDEGKCTSISTMRQQRRIAGSPYDMGIDWSGFSSQKWFILGAVGLAKAPGVKPD